MPDLVATRGRIIVVVHAAHQNSICVECNTQLVK